MPSLPAQMLQLASALALRIRNSIMKALPVAMHALTAALWRLGERAMHRQQN